MAVNLIKLERKVYGQGSSTVSDDGLTANVKGNAGTVTNAGVPINKKIYFEINCISGGFNYFSFGIVNASGYYRQFVGSYYGNQVVNIISNIQQDAVINIMAKDVIGISFDLSKLSFVWYLNGILKGDFTIQSNSYMDSSNLIIVISATAAPTHIYTMNFGQAPFTYPAPSGYVSWFGAINAIKLYQKGNEIYGMSNSVFTKLTDDWNTITDAEKVDLFKSTNYETPTIDDLKMLGKFKVLMYAEADSQQTLSVKAVPHDQLILPRGLINTAKFEGIDRATVTSTIPADSVVKIIVTTDLTTYKTYDFVTQEWSAIDHTDNVQIKASGIDVVQLATIPRAAWDALTANSTGIGFAYMIGIESTANVCTVDKLQLQVDMRGSWDKAVHGTEYKYGYPANNVLNVKLLANGDYKINYSN